MNPFQERRPSRRNSIIVAEKYKDYQDPLTLIT